VGAAVLAITVGGCKVGPNYVRPDMPVPDAWHVDLVAGLNDEPAGVSPWWRAFGDEDLDELITLAGARNLDLQTAASRITEARAQYGIAAADLYPQVMAFGLISWNHRADKLVSDIIPNSAYVAALDMSWEVDLFGRVRRATEAAKADVGMMVEDWRDLLVTIRAEVAGSYISLRALQLEASILRRTIRAQSESLEVTTQRYEGGIADDLELSRAQASLADLESQLPGIQTRIARAINRISVLIGEAPGPLRDRLGAPERIPSPPGRFAVGIPADVVRRRPDIRAAERALAASTARIGVATANLYPRFRISGQIGFESSTFTNWFDAQNWSGGIGPQLSWPLFEGGKVISGIRVADAQAEQALLNYEQTVLKAFEEVENALIAHVELLASQFLLTQTVASRARIVTLTEQRYDAGVDNLQTVLEAQRSLLDSQIELARSTGEVSNNAVSIYKAIGGDWELWPGPEPPEQKGKKTKSAGVTQP
jgi:NodT family efflux transporter outer membrane factor (OMF) lipoprotein